MHNRKDSSGTLFPFSLYTTRKAANRRAQSMKVITRLLVDRRANIPLCRQGNRPNSHLSASLMTKMIVVFSFARV